MSAEQSGVITSLDIAPVHAAQCAVDPRCCQGHGGSCAAMSSRVVFAELPLGSHPQSVVL